jgi:hypothetical protein
MRWVIAQHCRRAVQTRKFFPGQIFSLAWKTSTHLRGQRKFASL